MTKSEFVAPRVISVTVTVPVVGEASAENLGIAINALLDRARRFSPDGRFDWSRAAVDWKE